MKSQSEISAVGCLAILFVLGVIALAIIPNFFKSSHCYRRHGCVQSLGTWRKVMEMYANDHEKSWYPKELSGKTGSPDDVNLLNSLGKYINVTNILRDCTETVFTSVTLTSGFTISAIAKDRNHTPLTATVDTITYP